MPWTTAGAGQGPYAGKCQTHILKLTMGVAMAIRAAVVGAIDTADAAWCSRSRQRLLGGFGPQAAAARTAVHVRCGLAPLSGQPRMLLRVQAETHSCRRATSVQMPQGCLLHWPGKGRAGQGLQAAVGEPAQHSIVSRRMNTWLSDWKCIASQTLA